MHLALGYPRLDFDATIRLYEILLDRTITEQKSLENHEFKVKREAILKFARKHYLRLERRGLSTWNGRQIRNAFQTAITLAEYEARQSGTKVVVLAKKQFEEVAAASRELRST